MLRMAHSLCAFHALFPRRTVGLQVVHSALLICLVHNNMGTNTLRYLCPQSPEEHFFQARQLKKKFKV